MFPIKDNIPTHGVPFVTLTLILANVVVYGLAISHGGSLISGPDAHVIIKYGAIPYSLTHPNAARVGLAPAWETPFTAMFIHASILHLAGNMLFLWIFGNIVERALGPVKFTGFYLVGGLVALALQVAIEPNSTAPTVGAAGAVGAVIAAHLVLNPRAAVLTLVLIPRFFTVIELPSVVMLGVWFAMQAGFGAAHLTNPIGGGGVMAYFAHVGGLVFGALAIRSLTTRHPVAH